MIILVIVLFVLFIVFYKLDKNARFLVKIFRTSNVVVFGKKRKGKDLIFQKVINKRKEKYYANIPYGHDYNPISLSDVSVSPNTYEDLINGTITPISPNPDREKADIYISDGGVHLPSQYNHILNKKYPSMPLYYSLSGHLYDSNVHVCYNGSISRLWDKLREQADEYIKALGTVHFLGFFFTKLRYFEQYETAVKNILPMKGSFFNKETKALKKQFDATHGVIKDMWIFQFRKSLYYDTRYFRQLLFDLTPNLIITQSAQPPKA